MSTLDSITVFSPATIANLGCGYDILGLSLKGLGEELIVTRRDDDQLVIETTEPFNIPTEPTLNTATAAAKALLADQGSDQGFSFRINKKIKPGSGLGTSASSAAGAAYAVNELLGKPYSREQLIRFAIEGEKVASGIAHADNVSPCLLGGITLIRSVEPLEVLQLPSLDELLIVIVHPLIELKTAHAKKILRRQVDLQEAVQQMANLGTFVSGLYEKDKKLIGKAIEDRIAEPARSLLIPEYQVAKQQALQMGALGCNIAGSGPSIFAFVDDDKTAAEIENALQSIYRKVDIECHTYITHISSEGVTTT